MSESHLRFILKELSEGRNPRVGFSLHEHLRGLLHVFGNPSRPSTAESFLTFLSDIESDKYNSYPTNETEKGA